MVPLRGIVILAMFAFVLSLALPTEEPFCLQNGKRCLRNDDCCDSCCHQGKCVQYADTCIKENNPCHYHTCPDDKVCYLHKVMCVHSPCPPIPACRPKDPDYD